VPESRELRLHECEALLRSGVVGRVGLVTPTGPHVMPVNYSVVDGAIVIRTSPYSLLGTYGRDTTLAFEIDYFDHAYHRGCSVLARGRSSVVSDAAEIDHIRQVWEPRPWASGVRSLFLRLRWNELTGRQLGDDWDPLRELPVRRVV
jgi:nitroimidazol reductase NimA-like FMN-containing flavoprotein (pyridoxamine 5'-phosphate oxidase superfamily)